MPPGPSYVRLRCGPPDRQTGAACTSPAAPQAASCKSAAAPPRSLGAAKTTSMRVCRLTGGVCTLCVYIVGVHTCRHA